MNLNLEKPIVFFDLETTGLQISKDRIVEISILKVFPNGNKESKTWLVNPTIPIPPETTEIHGISNEKVANEPTFQHLAEEISELIKNCDLGGYNSNKFDIPLLAEEFLRSGIDFNMKNRKSIDVQNIFHKMEKRTLVAAYKFYCNKDLTNAHSAEADTIATYEVLLSQLKKYNELENNTRFLAEFSQVGGKFADMAGFIRYNEEGKKILSFGKYRGETLEKIWNENPGYFSWINQADFPLYTKNMMSDFATQMKLKNKFNS
ncbi:MAG: DNA polymerase III subunit epsilon [Flavobacteriales bacterium]|nr:DNA polymerase III subunit epsilon [Flavobacteriales bacterium]|tara:strand:- start:14925 stop:15710 length:786 start_codon:yes stop_codon:yes gene_type:complete